MSLMFGGTASPNSDYPQQIEVVKGENRIKIENKNLFDENTVTFIVGVLDDNGEPTGSTSSHYTDNFYKVKSETKYYLSGTLSTSSALYRIYYYDSNKNWLSRSTTLSGNTIFTTPIDCEYIRIQVARQISLKTGDIMLVESPVEIPYVPHQEQNYTITLPDGMELCKIGDYQDRIYGTPDNWFLEKYSIKTINVENLFKTFDTGMDGKKYVLVSKTSLEMEVGAYNNRMLCNKFKQQTVPTNRIAGEFLTISNNDNVQFIVDDKYTSLEEVKADITDVIVVGVSTTPIITPITDTTLINQLDDIYNKLKTYQGITHVTQANADLPFILTLDYKKSNLLRLENLENAILSQGANV